MNRNRELVGRPRLEDRTLPGRGHEYLAQVVDGVPVLGGGVARQLDAAGVTISLLGTLHLVLRHSQMFGHGCSDSPNDCGPQTHVRIRELWRDRPLGIDVDTTPGLSAAEMADRVEQAQGGRLVASRRPALLVLPLPDGTHTLAYRVAMSDGRYYFVDADDGRLVHIADAFRRQSAVGGGSDSRGRQRKVSSGSVAASRTQP